MSASRTNPNPKGPQDSRVGVESTATTETKEQGNYDKLLTKLNERGIGLFEFAHVKENRRKKMLQDQYDEIKSEGKWMYDEPIEFPPEILAKEKEAQKKKLEEASRAR